MDANLTHATPLISDSPQNTTNHLSSWTSISCKEENFFPGLPDSPRRENPPFQSPNHNTCARKTFHSSSPTVKFFPNRFPTRRKFFINPGATLRYSVWIINYLLALATTPTLSGHSSPAVLSATWITPSTPSVFFLPHVQSRHNVSGHPDPGKNKGQSATATPPPTTRIPTLVA